MNIAVTVFTMSSHSLLRFLKAELFPNEIKIYPEDAAGFKKTVIFLGLSPMFIFTSPYFCGENTKDELMMK